MRDKVVYFHFNNKYISIFFLQKLHVIEIHIQEISTYFGPLLNILSGNCREYFRRSSRDWKLNACSIFINDLISSRRKCPSANNTVHSTDTIPKDLNTVYSMLSNTSYNTAPRLTKTYAVCSDQFSVSFYSCVTTEPLTQFRFTAA